MEESLSQFRQVIGGILCPDNDVRRQAEKAYDSMQNDPNMYFLCLIRLLDKDTDFQVRAFCAIILRQQVLPGKKIWNSVSAEVQTEVKSVLYRLFSTEQHTYIRNKVIDAMAVLAARLFKDAESQNSANVTEAWPEVIPLALEGCAHQDIAIRAACFSMIEKLAEFCVASLLNYAQPLLERIQAAFSADLPVALAAARAGLSVLVSAHLTATQTPSPEVAAEMAAAKQLESTFLCCVDPTTGLIAVALNKGDENAVSEILDALQTVARVLPAALKPRLADLVKLVEQIAKHEDIEVPLRTAAVTLLMTLGKTPAGRAVVRKCLQYGQTLIPLTFEFLSRIEHCPEWEREEDFDDQEENPLAYTGVYMLQSLLVALGAKDLTPVVLNIIQQYGKNPSLQSQHAAMAALATLASDAPKHLKKKLAEPVALIVKLLAPGTHPRVKYDACAAIYQLSESLTSKSAVTLTNAIIPCLDPNSNPLPVVGQACQALAICLASTEVSKVAARAPDVLQHMGALLRGPGINVRLNALTVVSALALVLKERFEPYTRDIVTGLASIMADVNSRGKAVSYTGEHAKLRMLRDNAMQSLSVIAASVGAAVFAPYVAQVMELLVATQALEVESDSPSLEHVFRAYERLAETMGAQFAPFLPQVLPYLLRTASQDNFTFYFDVDEKGELSAADQARASELTSDRGFSSLTIGMRGQGNKKLFLNTSMVQDKILACEMVGTLAVAIKEAFAPHVAQCAQVLMPLCTYLQNPRVRSAAVTSLPALMDSLKTVADANTQMAFWSECLRAFDLPVWVERELPSGLGPLMLSVGATLDCLEAVIAPEQLQLVSTAIAKGLDLCEQRRREMEAAVNEADEEAVEDHIEAMEVENSAIDGIMALSNSLLRNSAANYMPFFDAELAPRLQKMLSNPKDPHSFCAAVACFADTIGNAKELGHKYIPHLMPLFLRFTANVTDHELRRGAAYGVVACYREMGAHFEPHLEAAMQALVTGLAAKYDDPEDEELCEAANDNVMSALAELVAGFGLEQQKLPEDVVRHVIGQMVDQMPRIFDEDEATRVHHQLAVWLQRDPTLVFGKNNEKMGRVATVLAELFCQAEDYPILDEADEAVLRETWARVRSSMNEEQYAQLVAQIDEDFRGYLQ